MRCDILIGFIAVERFSPDNGNSWNDFINFSGLTQLEEVVSLDALLCPSLIDELDNLDYQYVLYQEHSYILFSSFDWLCEKVKVIKNKQILAVLHEPQYECSELLNDNRFSFCGYDLIEDASQVSALLNCDGFGEAFMKTELSSLGLITDYKKASVVRKRLNNFYPEEPHAYCDIWAIWRLKECI